MESGNKGVSLDCFKLLARALNMSPSQLMELIESYTELGKQDINSLTRYQKTLIEALQIVINNQKDDRHREEDDVIK